MTHWPQLAPLAADGMQKPEGYHHGTPDDPPNAPKRGLDPHWPQRAPTAEGGDFVEALECQAGLEVLVLVWFR